MIEVKFGPPKDTFGFQSLKSFIDHVDCYQHVSKITHGSNVIKFNFFDKQVPVYDFFELRLNDNLHFDKLNIIVVETLKQFLEIKVKLPKAKKYIILSESYWNQKKYPAHFKYELVYMPWDIIDCQNRLANRSSLYFHLIDIDFFASYKPKYNFLCLVGRNKFWRNKFVDKLKTSIDLTNTLTSYYGQNLGNKDLLNIDIPYNRSCSKVEFEEKFYREIGIPDSSLSYNLSYFTKNELFYLTKFSVVVETEAEHEEYHVTEKTIKCLILGHPFVVISSPKFLHFLRSLGFTTFGTLFNEDYDNIYDLDDRIDAVIKLIKNLENQTFDIDMLKSIQQKNINALIKLRGKETYSKFLKLINV